MTDRPEAHEGQLQHRISPSMVRASNAYGKRLGLYHQRSSYLSRISQGNRIDLAFGDPQTAPSKSLVSTLQSSLVPQDASWFAYKRTHPPAADYVSAKLCVELEVPFSASDVCFTNGQFGGLAVAIRTVCSPGDNIIFWEPSWFYYESLITAVGGIAIGLPWRDVNPDIEVLARTITANTAAIIVNSPHNPSGRIAHDDFLLALSNLLQEASARYGRPIYIISDEAYRKIVFEKARVSSPARYYPWTLVLHTYSKTLLTPGIRLGYIAIPATMPRRDELRCALEVSQLVSGWIFPDTFLMYALAELDRQQTDISLLEAQRDHLISGLDSIGLLANKPAAGLYCLVATPNDDWDHTLKLEDENLFVMPGSIIGAPGFVRVSLTAGQSVIDDALQRWKRVLHGHSG